MRALLLAVIGLPAWSGIARSCPACGDPAAAGQRFDLVAALLLTGSFIVIARALIRNLLRRFSTRRTTRSSPGTENPS